MGTTNRSPSLRANMMPRYRRDRQRTISCFHGSVLSISIRAGRIPACQRALDHFLSQDRRPSWNVPSHRTKCDDSDAREDTTNVILSKLLGLELPIFSAQRHVSAPFAKPQGVPPDSLSSCVGFFPPRSGEGIEPGAQAPGKVARVGRPNGAMVAWSIPQIPLVEFHLVFPQ